MGASLGALAHGTMAACAGLLGEALLATQLAPAGGIVEPPILGQTPLFLATVGLSEPGLDKLVHQGFDLLGLQSYLTCGPEETRAWVIHKGDKAPKAAGVIHTDFERGFIKAEVINWKLLLELGSEAAAKAKGAMRIEGKEYVVQDGDVMHFMFNV